MNAVLAKSSFSLTFSLRRTAAWISSPKDLWGTAKDKASATAGWRSKTSSTSKGEIFSPPRLIQSC